MVTVSDVGRYSCGTGQTQVSMYDCMYQDIYKATSMKSLSSKVLKQSDLKYLKKWDLSCSVCRVCYIQLKIVSGTWCNIQKSTSGWVVVPTIKVHTWKSVLNSECNSFLKWKPKQHCLTHSMIHVAIFVRYHDPMCQMLSGINGIAVALEKPSQYIEFLKHWL